MTNITLKQGDCLKLMNELADKSIDCIITDPPYGINGKYDSYIDTEENLIKLILPFMEEALRVAALHKNTHLHKKSESCTFNKLSGKYD